MLEGVEGLLRGKTRPSRIPPLSAKVVAWVASRTHDAPPGETIHLDSLADDPRSRHQRQFGSPDLRAYGGVSGFSCVGGHNG